MPVKGLLGVLEGLVGDSVTIELKSGNVVTGTLVSIEQSMTAHLSGAKIARPKGEPELHDELSIRGTNIRMFELSEATDIDALLRKAEQAEKRKAAGVGGKKPAPKQQGGAAAAAPNQAGKRRDRDD